MPENTLPELAQFLDSWKKDANNVKDLFEAFHSLLAGIPDLELDFKGRPGVSYSLRARHTAQAKRSLFVLVDVIDDDPGARWLSVCFYADLISDPENRGDVVPGGLMGEDACCFDMEEPDADSRAYLLARIREAAAVAAKGE
jgi:hypothetical protein